MQLSQSELVKIVDLQRLVYCLTEDIKYLTALARQLASDKCELKVAFALHNEKICEENKAKVAAEEMVTMDGILPFIMGYPIKRPSALQKCRHELQVTVSESNGLRILQVLLEEKQAAKTIHEAEIQKIFSKHAENPIQSLHTNSL